MAERPTKGMDSEGRRGVDDSETAEEEMRAARIPGKNQVDKQDQRRRPLAKDEDTRGPRSTEQGVESEKEEARSGFWCDSGSLDSADFPITGVVFPLQTVLGCTGKGNAEKCPGKRLSRES